MTFKTFEATLTIAGGTHGVMFVLEMPYYSEMFDQVAIGRFPKVCAFDSVTPFPQDVTIYPIDYSNDTSKPKVIPFNDHFREVSNRTRMSYILDRDGR